MGNFEASGWSHPEESQSYLEKADIYIQDRRLLYGVAAGFLRRFVAVRPGCRVVDLGCGDGALGEALLTADPSISLTAIDGSAAMLAAAERRLARWPGTAFVEATFEAILREGAPLTGIDLVASAFAVHHVPFADKSSFFGRVGEMLAPGGHFLNIDILRPSSSAHEAWYDEIWRDWIIDRQRAAASGEDLSATPEDARRKPENRYETLDRQLEDLRRQGFIEVECHCRRGLFGIYSGRRP